MLEGQQESERDAPLPQLLVLYSSRTFALFSLKMRCMGKPGT